MKPGYIVSFSYYKKTEYGVIADVKKGKVEIDCSVRDCIPWKDESVYTVIDASEISNDFDRNRCQNLSERYKLRIGKNIPRPAGPRRTISIPIRRADELKI